MPGIETFLSSSELFEGLDPDFRADLVKDMAIVPVDPDQVIFAKGDEGDAVYFILEGRIHLEANGVVVMSRGDGDCVGEFALIDDGPRSATARAAGPGRLIRWPSAAFQRALSTNPTVAAGFFRLLTTKLREDVGTQVDYLLEQQRWRLELQWAHEVQHGLLPTEEAERGHVRISGHWSPAYSVGGDLYDHFPLGDAVGLFIADVTGHGVYSALLAAMAKSCVHTQAVVDASPRAVMQALRRCLGLSVGRRLLMSCVYLVVEPDGRYRYANAGHPPALHCQAATGDLRELPALDPILGVLDPDGDPPEQEEGRLAPGDILVLYTDGLIEAQNERGEQLGAARLCELIHAAAGRDAAEVKNRLVAAAGAHRAGREAEDDTTVLVLRYR